MSELTGTIPYNFDDIYADLEAKFIAKDYDALYEGSNTAQLITAMTYLVSMLNANTSVNINESVLTLANKRDNILQDARLLGYEISHVTSYKYNLTLTATSDNATYNIPKYSTFTSGGNTYYFMGDDEGKDIDLIGFNIGDTYDIEVIEGDLKTFADYPDVLHVITETIINEYGEDEPQYYIDIPFTSVEDNGIEVFLTYYDEFGDLKSDEPWYKSDQFMIDKDTVLDKEFMRLDNIDYKMPRIYFKLAGIGPGIRLGTIVDMNVLVSKGELGEMSTLPITALPNVSIDIMPTIVTEGTEEESAQSIKDNAPLFHNSANRVITRSDYIAMSTRQSSVNSVEVWDGDAELIAKAGYIWFSFIPSTLSKVYGANGDNTSFDLFEPDSLTNWYLESEEIKSTTTDIDGNITNPGVWDVLNQYKVPTLIFQNRHPIYIDFNYDINIMKYIIKTSKADIHQDVFDVILDYFDGVEENEKLEIFDTEYFNSNLEKRIDTDLTDITGFNSSLVNQIMLTSNNLSYENINQDDININIPLGVPYEIYFLDTGELISAKLPQIDTLLFNGVDNLVVDFGTPSINDVGTEVLTYDINLGAVKVGEYNLFNSIRKDIIIDLYVKGATPTVSSVYETTTLLEADFDVVKYLDLSYFSPNFKVIKNCIPRLNQVIFS